MTAVRARPAAWLLRVLGVLAMLAALGVAGAAPAAAHAELLETTPAADSALDDPPEQIGLHFSEPVDPAPDGVRLVRSDGAGDGRQIDGTVGRIDGDSATVRFEPASELAAGTYVVAWRVTSADSHPVQGAFTFRVGAAPATDDASALVSRLLSEQAGSSSAGGLLAVGRWLSYAGVLLAIGWLLFGPLGLTVSPRSLGAVREPAAALWRPIGLAGVLGAVGTLVMVGAQGVGLDRRWSALVDPGAYGDVFDTRSGRWWAARLVALVLVAAVGLAVSRRVAQRVSGRERPSELDPLDRSAGGSRDVAVLLAAAAAVVLAVVTAFGGHGATGRWPLVGLIATVTHLLAAGVWAGGLVVLAGAIVGRVAGPGWRTLVPRFSWWALVAVIALVVSGTINGVRQVGELDLLTSTDYGRILLVKVAVVAVLVAVAVTSRRHATGAQVTAAPLVGAGRLGASAAAAPASVTAGSASVAGEVPASAGARSEERSGARLPGALRRSVRIEVVLMAAALAATALLVNQRPALGQRPELGSATAVVGERTAQIVLDPARTGGTTMHVYLSSPRGSLDRAQEITVTATLEDRDIGPLTLPLFDAGPNHLSGPDVDLPLPGRWRVDVVARYGEFEQVEFVLHVDVGR